MLHVSIVRSYRFSNNSNFEDQPPVTSMFHDQLIVGQWFSLIAELRTEVTPDNEIDEE